MIAEELGMDPAEFRLKNLLGEGEEDAVGHRLHDVRFREVLAGGIGRRPIGAIQNRALISGAASRFRHGISAAGIQVLF